VVAGRIIKSVGGEGRLEGRRDDGSKGAVVTQKGNCPAKNNQATTAAKLRTWWISKRGGERTAGESSFSSRFGGKPEKRGGNTREQKGNETEGPSKGLDPH